MNNQTTGQNLINTLSPELMERRKAFFEKFNKEYPPINDFVATASGTVMAMPETDEGWQDYKENLQYVDGITRN